MDKREMLSLKDAYDLDKKSADRLYCDHVNPALFTIYKILGLAEMDIVSAEGVEIHLRDGRKILDFTSAIGVLGLGHNHPRIIAAEKFCHDHKIIDAIKVAPNKLQAALAYNLSCLLPGPLDVAFFTVSGAEAVEAALKLAEKVQGPSKRKIVAMSGAYHGKTHGTLAITRSENFGEGFLYGIPAENVIEIPFGDLGALKQTLQHSKNEIIAVIVEPVQGQNVQCAPKGFLKALTEVCRASNVISIFDEVKVGMGRTGTFCAFMEDDTVPDIVTISKCLGGGKRAIGAMVTSKHLFKKAYGKKKNAATHTTTFGGLGESCAVAIEALNIVGDPEFLSGVQSKGHYLRAQLEALKDKYPTQIRSIQGRGLFLGVEFDFGPLLNRNSKMPRIPFLKSFEVILIGGIIRELYRKHNILCHFSASDPSILHVMPPLIVTQEQMDQFLVALEKVLRDGFFAMGRRFVWGNLF